jgi:hypothetical protein
VGRNRADDEHQAPHHGVEAKPEESQESRYQRDQEIPPRRSRSSG